MTEAERRTCNALAASYMAATGAPLFVPPSLYAAMRRQGLDLTNICATTPITYNRVLSALGKA